MTGESATYLEDLVDLDDDDLDSLATLGPLAQRRAEINPDEARAQGRRTRLVPPEHFDGQDFKRDDHLEILANQLIAAHPTTLGHIRNVRVAYLWKRKGGGKGGKGIYGKCQSLSGVSQFWGKADFLIWLAADYCTLLHFTARQLEALLFHELLHIGWDPDKNLAVLVEHDFAGFLKELEVYGAWDQNLEELARQGAQLRLFS